MEYTLIKNAIKCNKCGDEIESTHRHDFKFCSCESVAIDGGLTYQRIIGNIEDWDITPSIWEAEDGSRLNGVEFRERA